MKATSKRKARAGRIWASVIVGSTCFMLIGYAVAGPVVQSTEKTTQSTPTRQSSDLSGLSWPQQGSIEDMPSTPSGPSSALPPSTPGGQQSAAPQQFPQPMPLPPTYAPGTPGAAQGSGVDPYGGMPIAPTAYGPYGSPNPSPTSSVSGTGRPDLGWGMGGGGGAMGTAAPGGGMTGYGAPPAPTPTSSLGRAALADPGFGRYQSANVREATAARQPATIGRAQSQILRGSKPFTSYRPDSAYSPYMRLNRDFNSNPGVNTYYDWVKPLLEQQQENRQVGRNIQGLESTARSGYQALQDMRQRPGNMVPGAVSRAPATYMNTGQYYPGFNK